MLQLTEYHSDWSTQFTQERARLLKVLGAITEGGSIEQIAHVGATNVPGLPARPIIDIALTVIPFPLEPLVIEKLVMLGYTPTSAGETAPEQTFQTAQGNFQLHICEAGQAPWYDHVLLSDYLRHEEPARRRYGEQKQHTTLAGETAYQAMKAALLPELVKAAHAWWVGHYAFRPVESVANELGDYPHPWYISSGWALDLFLGRVVRYHHDVDVVVARQDQLVLQRHLTERGWKLLTPLDGKLEPWPRHTRLELPRHQVHAHRDGAFIDFLLTDFESGVWRYRRNPVILRNLEQAHLRTANGIPYLAPELVLLFKSRNTGRQERSKDQTDFEKVYQQLEPERRAWLRWALTATTSEHPWIAQL